MSVTVSIVTPSYNQARYLDETIRSVLCQRDQVHEYFVFDGGSSDGSADIIRRYAPLIDHWVSEKDKGQSDAIHKGLSRATGDILFWLNSDDVLLPGAVARVRRAFDERPDWHVLTGYNVWIDADSRIEQMNRIPADSLAWTRWGVSHICQPTTFFRRSLYEKIGGLNLDLHCVMDTDLWWRMLLDGSRWGLIPEYLAAFRHHEEAKGSKWLAEYAREHRWMEEKYPDLAHPGFRSRLGRFAYRFLQIASGRYPTARAHARRHRGRPVVEVFGDWNVPEPTSTGGPV